MKSIACAFVFLVLCSPAQLQGQQSDAPSAFDKCRIVTTVDIADKTAPTFGSYHIAAQQAPHGPKLDVKSNSVAREYETVLRRGVAKGPNFAGHYRVVAWGCGSSCTMFAVVELVTGRVITPKGFSQTSGVYFGVDQSAFPESQSEYWLLAYRKDSRLLVVLGDLDEDETREGAFYFVLERQSLRLVHSTHITKDCGNLPQAEAKHLPAGIYPALASDERAYCAQFLGSFKKGCRSTFRADLIWREIQVSRTQSGILIELHNVPRPMRLSGMSAIHFSQAAAKWKVCPGPRDAR